MRQAHLAFSLSKSRLTLRAIVLASVLTLAGLWIVHPLLHGLDLDHHVQCAICHIADSQAKPDEPGIDLLLPCPSKVLGRASDNIRIARLLKRGLCNPRSPPSVLA